MKNTDSEKSEVDIEKHDIFLLRQIPFFSRMQPDQIAINLWTENRLHISFILWKIDIVCSFDMGMELLAA